MQCLWTTFHVISQLSKEFLTFVPQPVQYWSNCTLCLRSLFRQNISRCTSLRYLALQSKRSLIICLYLAPFTVPFILRHLPVVCGEKPADSMLLSQPFFKVAMVISCDRFLADAELKIMADKFKYSCYHCMQSFVFCSQSFTGHFTASGCCHKPNTPDFCWSDYCPSNKTCHNSCFISMVPTFTISSNQKFVLPSCSGCWGTRSKRV